MNFLLSPYGRISRRTYWAHWVLPYVLILLLTIFLDRALALTDPQATPAPVFRGLMSLVLFWPSIAITTKRFHDRGMSGWWNVAPYLAGLLVAGVWYQTRVLGLEGATANDRDLKAVLRFLATMAFAGVGLYLLINLLLPGTKGPNKYGEDPLHNVADTFK